MQLFFLKLDLPNSSYGQNSLKFNGSIFNHSVLLAGTCTKNDTPVHVLVLELAPSIHTNLCDEDSELVEVAETVRTSSQVSNHLVEPLSSGHWVL